MSYKKIKYFVVVLSIFVSVTTICIVFCANRYLVNLALSRLDSGPQPSLSPNDTTLVFASCQTDKGIYTYNLASGHLKRITTTKYYDNYPSFSPDGNFIVFSRFTKDRAGIWRFHLSDSRLEFLTTPPIYATDTGACFSPSGNKIAFLRRSYYDRNIMIYDIRTNTSRAIIPNSDFYLNSDSVHLTWKNDTELVCVIHGMNGSIFSNIDAEIMKYVDQTEFSGVPHRDVSYNRNMELSLLCPKQKYRYQIGIRSIGSHERWKFVTDLEYNVFQSRFAPSGNFIVFTHIVYNNGQPEEDQVCLYDLSQNTILDIVRSRPSPDVLAAVVAQRVSSDLTTPHSVPNADAQ